MKNENSKILALLQSYYHMVEGLKEGAKAQDKESLKLVFATLYELNSLTKYVLLGENPPAEVLARFSTNMENRILSAILTEAEASARPAVDAAYHV